MAKVFVTSTINLPVESVQTIIDIDDPRVNIPAKESMSIFAKKQDDERKFRSMNSIMIVNPDFVGSRDIPDDQIARQHDIVIINELRRRKIEKTNEMKFYKINLVFRNGNTSSMIVPSYVKIYSAHTGTFIPVEFIRSRNLLIDAAGNYVKTSDAEQVEDFKLTDYYSYKVIYEVDEKFVENGHAYPGICNFYLNNLLCNIPYNNFQIKDTE